MYWGDLGFRDSLINYDPVETSRNSIQSYLVKTNCGRVNSP